MYVVVTTIQDINPVFFSMFRIGKVKVFYYLKLIAQVISLHFPIWVVSFVHESCYLHVLKILCHVLHDHQLSGPTS